jgi:pyridoxal phosphate enzyme (YggS family)
MNDMIIENVNRARERIAAACERVGRPSDGVTIVGVTKTFGPERVRALIEAGITDIGENRIQEFLEKAPKIDAPCRWHLVGTLQRNKAAKAIGRFELIHSVDRIKLAYTLNRLGEERGTVTPVLIEVNTSGEATKHGFEPVEVPERAAEIAGLEHLRLEGLMTIGPLTDDEHRIRQAFRDLFTLSERIEESGRMQLPHLSMGMSDDFEIAVEEGATLVRLGRVLLGDRPG